MVASEILKSSKRLEKKYNFYSSDSLLSQINRREVSKIDMQTKEILTRAKRFYIKTEKIFDITMGTLKVTRELQTIEELERRVEELMPFVGVEHFKIRRNRISFDNPYTLIDLGGVVKEFAVDMAVKLLKRAKIESALVNFGGDIYALGRKPNGERFSVGIKNPLNPREFLHNIELENQALTTSASYERNYKIEDKIYSHIISKGSSENEILSASVISPSTLESGVYSTSLMIKPNLKVPFQKVLVEFKAS
jgi:thiamine biosynthesis lipoprotein